MLRSAESWDRDLSPVVGPPFGPGDPAPFFKARASNNPDFAFGSVAGRYVVLCFFGTLAAERSRRTVELLTTRCRNRFDDQFACFFGVSLDPEDRTQGRARQQAPGLRYFWDFDGEVTRLYTGRGEAGSAERFAERGFTLVLDPLLRVIANIPFGDPEEHEGVFARVFDALPPPDRHAGAEIPAPVLVLPRVFEPDLCRTLIDLYEERGGAASGFMQQRGGQTVGVMDDSFKRRRDLNLEAEAEWEPLRRAILTRVGRRVVPAVWQAFGLRLTRIERYLIACYDAQEGGFFRGHRDNTTLGTAHRRFAVTINLNADEYEGGDLRFPEFGSRTYRAPTGGAVVFGCGLLHEATPVTRGRRYACLPFLYDEEGAAIRERNRKYLVEDVIDKNAARVTGAAGTLSS